MPGVPKMDAGRGKAGDVDLELLWAEIWRRVEAAAPEGPLPGRRGAGADPQATAATAPEAPRLRGQPAPRPLAAATGPQPPAAPSARDTDKGRAARAAGAAAKASPAPAPRPPPAPRQLGPAEPGRQLPKTTAAAATPAHAADASRKADSRRGRPQRASIASAAAAAVDVWCGRGKRQQAPHHYETLGLTSSASVADVRAAYRREALASHPDKGGDPQRFMAVAAAFEVLGDEVRRKEYDAEVQSVSTSDLRARGAGAPASAAAPAAATAADEPWERRRAWRAVHDLLLGSREAAWPSRLATLDPAALRAILESLEHPKVPAPQNGRSAEVAEAAHRCLRRHRNGAEYSVTVAWASVSVSTCCTTSLAQAIDWQIALTRARGDTKPGLHGRGAQRHHLPLSPAAVAELRAAEPEMELTFRVTVEHGGQSAQTPGTTDLQQALAFGARFLKALQSPKAEARLEDEKQQANRDVIKAKREHASRTQRLKAAIGAELASRDRKRKGELLALPPARRIRGKTPVAALALMDRQPTAVVAPAGGAAKARAAAGAPAAPATAAAPLGQAVLLLARTPGGGRKGPPPQAKAPLQQKGDDLLDSNTRQLPKEKLHLQAEPAGEGSAKPDHHQQPPPSKAAAAEAAMDRGRRFLQQLLARAAAPGGGA